MNASLARNIRRGDETTLHNTQGRCPLSYHSSPFTLLLFSKAFIRALLFSIFILSITIHPTEYRPNQNSSSIQKLPLRSRMGNTHSRQRYAEVAREALLNARDLHMDVGGHTPRGAIVAYCDGRINGAQAIHHCTPIEFNEFARLALPILTRWTQTHGEDFRCQPGPTGRCRYPDELLHHRTCQYRAELPSDIQYPPPSHHQGGHAHQQTRSSMHNLGGGHPHAQGPHPGSRGHGHPFSANRGGFGSDLPHRGPAGPFDHHRGVPRSDDESSAYDDSYDSFSDGSDDDDGETAYSDEDDLYTRSMSQASEYGFAPGRHRQAMHNGPHHASRGMGHAAARHAALRANTLHLQEHGSFRHGPPQHGRRRH